MLVYKYNPKKDAFAKKLTSGIKNEYVRECFRCILNLKFCFIERLIQNYHIEFKNLKAKKLNVILIPEKNAISGGVLSFFKLADYLKMVMHEDDTETILMTRCYPTKETFVKQTHFNTCETAFRFEQITKFKKIKKLTIHIPEYAIRDFYKLLPADIKRYLSKINNVQINILNQNISLMPDKEEFAELYKITDNITQTVAHISYCTQEIADKYNLKTLFFPIAQDFTSYPSTKFPEKKDIIIYSPDYHPKKEAILNKIRKELPEFELIEIRNMKFEKFVRLASQAKFSISFGEGNDGYFYTPVVKDGIGFSVYNEEFFIDSKQYKDHLNLFSSYEEMEKNIVQIIKQLNADEKLYKKTNRTSAKGLGLSFPGGSKEKEEIYYSYFLKRLKRFIKNEFDYYPSTNHHQRLNHQTSAETQSGHNLNTSFIS